MEALLREYGWELFKWLAVGAGSLGLWILKRGVGLIERQGKRIEKLEKALMIQQAREDAWKEFGAPERRKP